MVTTQYSQENEQLLKQLGYSPDLYEDVDLSPIIQQPTLTMLILFKKNNVTESFAQVNGRSIIGNTIKSLKDSESGKRGSIFFITPDTESPEFKALNLSEQQESLVDSSLYASLPQILKEVTPDQILGGTTIQFTDNDDGELDERLEEASTQYTVRAVVAKIEVNSLMTMKYLSPNGVVTPTLIARNFRVLDVYRGPETSDPVRDVAKTMSRAQTGATEGRALGIQTRRELGVTNSLLSMANRGTPMNARKGPGAGTAPQGVPGGTTRGSQIGAFRKSNVAMPQVKAKAMAEETAEENVETIRIKGTGDQVGVTNQGSPAVPPSGVNAPDDLDI